MLTDRGRSLLALGGLTYFAAWAFGGRPLYPVAVGLVLAVAAAAVWVRVLRRPMTLQRTVPGEHAAGEDVPMQLELEVEGRLPPATLVARERLGRLGEREAPLRRSGGRLQGEYLLERVPRGRYPIEATEVVLEDPFGLERVELDVSRAEVLLVYPRLVELERLFSETGGQTPGGRRLLLRRTAGFELHSVREYEQGESLRRVHWPSTARRGELMVKELEDAPRDEAAVVLDADEATVVGEPPESTFELQVSIAGSLVRAHARRGRRTSLVVNGRSRGHQRVHSLDGDWDAALELLAAVQPDGHVPVATFLADESGPAARALEVTVVTAALPARLVDRLLQRTLAHHAISLVYVDPRSFTRAGGHADLDAAAQLARLQRAGIPSAVVRRGADLAGALAGERTPAHAVGGGRG
ncbi:MAG: DUF58 domain-containing protein [Thermoleophilia bacterium]|nr:DUF58 domain-containing protein [Thermoleophilia bacterium]